MADIKKSLIYISLTLVVLYTLPGFAINQLQPATDTQLQKILIDFTQYAEQARKEWQIPGMAIAIVKDNQIIYKKGFGVRNTKGEPVTPETIFNVASLTKSFTAALLAKQIEEEKYTWDTKVQQLYPEFKLYDSKATQEFAVKDLVAHDSGLSARALQFLPYFGYDQDYQIHGLREFSSSKRC
ncbi:MAG: beta-lactamase family protein [Gammaproteobacteria bacterium]|nr:beta-lactamase family protein [Gammaproteobacteria bacterium]